jgi:cystathionine beta-synthase
VADIIGGKRPIVSAKPDARLREVIDQMKTLNISQLPVVDKGAMRGIVAEVDLLRALVSGGKTLESPISEVVEDDYATVTPHTKIELLQGVLADAKVAIVEDAGQIVGIVTKIDLIDFLAKHSSAQPAVPPAAS